MLLFDAEFTSGGQTWRRYRAAKSCRPRSGGCGATRATSAAMAAACRNGSVDSLDYATDSAHHLNVRTELALRPIRSKVHRGVGGSCLPADWTDWIVPRRTGTPLRMSTISVTESRMSRDSGRDAVAGSPACAKAEANIICAAGGTEDGKTPRLSSVRGARPSGPTFHTRCITDTICSHRKALDSVHLAWS